MMSAYIPSVSARDVAIFFLQKDRDGKVFDDSKLKTMNGRTFYAGNARLNKYLHLAQNIFYAKTGHLLFEDSLYAYDNGGVVPDIQERYKLLVARKNGFSVDLPQDVQVFLNKMYFILENASIEKLIELSHEDPEWESKHSYYKKEDQIMDTQSHLKEYQNQYADIITLMDRI